MLSGFRGSSLCPFYCISQLWEQSSFALSFSFLNRRCFRITESHLCFARNSSSWKNTFDVFFVSGATKEIGKSLTRLCLRHRSIESKLKLYTKYVWCNNKHFRWVQLVSSNHICSKSKLKSATPITPSVRIEIGKRWVYSYTVYFRDASFGGFQVAFCNILLNFWSHFIFCVFAAYPLSFFRLLPRSWGPLAHSSLFFVTHNSLHVLMLPPFKNQYACPNIICVVLLLVWNIIHFLHTAAGIDQFLWKPNV